jgi:DNA-binding XRE family transcriptional regulator
MSSTLSDNGGGTGKDGRRLPPKLTARQNAQLRANFERALKAAATNESKLATETGVARHTLTNIGRSDVGPQLATLLLVAQKLGLYSIDELLGPSGTESISALAQS